MKKIVLMLVLIANNTWASCGHNAAEAQFIADQFIVSGNCQLTIVNFIYYQESMNCPLFAEQVLKKQFSLSDSECRLFKRGQRPSGVLSELDGIIRWER